MASDEERKYWCKFSLDTRIDDIDLGNKIKEKLISLDLQPEPGKFYRIDTTFSTEIYKDSKFYEYPVEWKPYELKELEKVKHEKNQLEKTILYGVLSNQVDKIRDELMTLDVNFNSATIIGLRTGDINQVTVLVYENEISNVLGRSKGKKKTEQETSKSICTSYWPDIQSSYERLDEFFGKIAQKMAEEEIRTRIPDKSQHTPNMKSAEELFTVLASAVLEELPDTSSSVEKLAHELITQAYLVDEWPLCIIGDVSTIPKENYLTRDSQVDCPEFLLFYKNEIRWTLQQIESLEKAKKEILSWKYRKKRVERYVVLHNLKNIRYNLFAEKNGEIIPVPKSEVHTVNRLLLSWVKSQN